MGENVSWSQRGWTPLSVISHQHACHQILCILDITAAFDTINHDILLQRLSVCFDYNHTALLIDSVLSLSLLALSSLKHRKHHPNHALLHAVFRKVRSSGHSYSTPNTSPRSQYSSKHSQLGQLMTPNKPFQRCSFRYRLTGYFYPNQSRRLKI